MAKILVLNGALRKNGATASLVKAFTEGAASSGKEVREAYILKTVSAAMLYENSYRLRAEGRRYGKDLC